MAENPIFSPKYNSSLTAIGCCLIAIGAGLSDRLSIWKYSLFAAAILLCLISVVRGIKAKA